MFVAGIYALINKSTGIRYIGQGIKVSARIAQQLSDLRCGRAKNKPMLEAYRQVGAENFTVEVLEYLPEDKAILTKREQYWIDFYGVDNLYNISPTAGTQSGVKHSAQARANMASSHKGLTRTPEHRAKLSAANKGKKMSPEARAKMVGRKMPPETRSKLSAANRGRKVSPETGAKISAANRGRKVSPETREKISASVKRTWDDRKRGVHHGAK